MTQPAQGIENLIRGSFKQLEPAVAATITVSDQFRDEQNNPAGIRAPHAIEAMRDAERVDRWEIDPGTSHVSIAVADGSETRPYAALITGVDVPATDGAIGISQAFRLYGDWPTNPTAALAAFIARFGLEIVVGGRLHGLFVPKYTGPPGGPIVALAGPPRSFAMSAMFRQDGTSGPLHVSWAYAIDSEAYKAYVAENRR